jgi:hypothetical protein
VFGWLSFNGDRRSFTEFFALLPLILGVGVYAVVSAYVDRDAHRKLIEGRRLAWLRDLGFTVEHIGEYWGYKGIYRGYWVRIYFNHLYSTLYRRNEELCFMVHYEPPRRADGQADMVRVRRLQEDLTPGLATSQWTRMFYHFRFLSYHVPFVFFTTASKVKRRLDRVVDKAIEHRLSPVDEAHVHAAIMRSAEHGPQVKTFLDAMQALRDQARTSAASASSK